MNDINVSQREYKVFQDSTGQFFVIWDDMVKQCLFAGSIGVLKEVENGSFDRNKNQLKNLLETQKTYNNKGKR